jgi:BirA family biotin operon repressor/biotin-[acetyl-CoA-carboxylase] ligase
METLFVGRTWIKLNRVDSTNNYAIKLCETQNYFEGTVISADEQFEGRGQRAQHWLSQAQQNITMSIILKPNFLEPQKQFRLNKAIALAVNDFIKQQGHLDVKIKWPNDILINNKKIAGILIENILRGNSIQHSVIGIGININQTDFPKELKATSLRALSGIFFDINKLSEKLCECIEKRYLQLKSNVSEIDQQYLKELFNLNQHASYLIQSEQVIAKLRGIDENGKLILELEDETLRSFDLKEIQFVY